MLRRWRDPFQDAGRRGEEVQGRRFLDIAMKEYLNCYLIYRESLAEGNPDERVPHQHTEDTKDRTLE